MRAVVNDAAALAQRNTGRRGQKQAVAERHVRADRLFALCFPNLLRVTLLRYLLRRLAKQRTITVLKNLAEIQKNLLYAIMSRHITGCPYFPVMLLPIGYRQGQDIFLPVTLDSQPYRCRRINAPAA